MAASWLIRAGFMSILICCFSFIRANEDYVHRCTTSGIIRGWVDYSPSVPIAKFFGVRYAKAPTGSLRFKPPVDPDKWDDVRDALQFGNECIQRKSPEFRFNNSVVPPTQSEDCLFLNIYTSSLGNASQDRLPVMVWIHGGGFLTGAGSQYDATSLATKDVILVTINYRLDVFGFLSSEDEVMPGNYGMLDKIAALKWVNKNIVTFAGDPNAVTIFGESAGSVSVSLLTLSPLARGLFQRAIMESGVSLSSWATDHPGNRVSPRMMARSIGAMEACEDIDNTTNLMNCLQQVNPDTLLNISISVQTAVRDSFPMVWVPRVETTFGFLPDQPIKLLARGQFNPVDTIRGFNTDETGIFFSQVLAANLTLTELKSAISVATFPTRSQFNKLDQNKVFKLMESTYIDWSTSHEIIKKQAVEGADDLFYIGSILKEMTLFVAGSSGNKHYMYEFNHLPSFKKYYFPEWMNANHADEIAYVFNVSNKEFVGNGFVSGPPEYVDILISERMMEMWTNFAKTANPTPSGPTSDASWKPYTLTSQNYLFIKAMSKLKTWSRPQALQFYDRIIELLDGFTSEGYCLFRS